MLFQNQFIGQRFVNITTTHTKPSPDEISPTENIETTNAVKCEQQVHSTQGGGILPPEFIPLDLSNLPFRSSEKEIQEFLCVHPKKVVNFKICSIKIDKKDMFYLETWTFREDSL